MLCACIDIGSNTTRVLVAEAGAEGVREVLQQRAFTRIGRDLRANGAIPPERIAEIAAVVDRQLDEARRAGALTVQVVATAAIRAARNRDDLLAALRSICGVEARVLDGHEEARLAFLGATRTLPEPAHGDVAVVDVGGGSTEIAIGTLADGVRWSSSFLVGSGALADRYLRTDPPSLPELRAARDHAMDVLATRAFPAADCAVAVGGSAASLRTVVGDALDPRSLKRALGVLCGGPCSDVAERYSLDADRVRLLPAGILILDSAAQRLRRPLQIGRGGLREGILLDMARSL
jgi:exopolyphosphatase / guanosine-5'-triphosphate,3'-diphosphate pyrophosphatase